MTNPYEPEVPFNDLDLGELEARLDAGEKATAGTLDALGGEILALKELVGKLLEQEQAKKPRRWAIYATDDEWATLADWVDALNVDYSLNRQYAIPPCWPQHPGVVEDLAALWSSWKRSAIAAETTRRNGTNDYIAWHDRWLWPTLKRLREGHYDIANCRKAHSSPLSAGGQTTVRSWDEA